MLPPKITIRFIRKDSDASDGDDDMVDIKNVSVDQFTLSYRYGPRPDKPSNTVTLCGNDVCRWMRRTIQLLANDADPFDSVQLDFPLMPTVLYRMNDLDDEYHAILDALEFAIDNWPDEPAPVEPALPRPASPSHSLHTEPYEEPSTIPHYTTWTRGRHHLFFDEDTDNHHHYGEDGEILNLCSPPAEF